MTYSIEQLHSYSFLFSSQTCARALRFGDIEDVRGVFMRFENSSCPERQLTVWDYLSKVYGILKRNYRNEYVYKNELINAFLNHNLCTKDTVIINEFGVGKSIADLAMFNGLSKAFEIKSERDSEKRLAGQIADYQKLFDECYVVVPENMHKKYRELVDESVGIFVFSHTGRGSMSLFKERDAKKNSIVNIDILMQSVRTTEYKWMVQQVTGSVPDVSCFKMFDTCKSILREVSDEQLHRMFNEVVKKRNQRIGELRERSSYVRQMFLSLGWNNKKEDNLIRLYNEYI
ncbi:MAG: sce7726 family protein [Candidatus Cryptobacteroides sp.]|nr:sce7726 family protein [Candidatus Cryptobacteroides sp.]